MPEHVTDDEIIEAMVTYGGSFAQAIGRAFQCADPNNRARIKAAFGFDLWPRYAELVQLRRQRSANA